MVWPVCRLQSARLLVLGVCKLINCPLCQRLHQRWLLSPQGVVVGHAAILEVQDGTSPVVAQMHRQDDTVHIPDIAAGLPSALQLVRQSPSPYLLVIVHPSVSDEFVRKERVEEVAFGARGADLPPQRVPLLQKAHVHIDDLIIQPTRTGHTLNILPPDVDAGVDVLYQDLIGIPVCQCLLVQAALVSGEGRTPCVLRLLAVRQIRILQSTADALLAAFAIPLAVAVLAARPPLFTL
mmetsp:Transcript_5239/g.15010  ORF Transcript_5239/g.15010 Transcript_5239/m.15010 type:complete len:237 (+) Transcript_5239:253-963(+)